MERIGVTEGPAYTPAITSGQYVFVTGTMVPTDNTFAGQAHAVLSRIGELLAEAGSGYDRVIRCGVYLTTADAVEEMNQIYRTYFTDGFPVRTTIICGLSAPTALIAVDCIAERG